MIFSPSIVAMPSSLLRQVLTLPKLFLHGKSTFSNDAVS